MADASRPNCLLFLVSTCTSVMQLNSTKSAPVSMRLDAPLLTRHRRHASKAESPSSSVWKKKVEKSHNTTSSTRALRAFLSCDFSHHNFDSNFESNFTGFCNFTPVSILHPLDLQTPRVGVTAEHTPFRQMSPCQRPSCTKGSMGNMRELFLVD